MGAKNRKAAKASSKRKTAISTGREGTPSSFIRESYLKGKDTDAIIAEGKKKFRGAKLFQKKAYVQWYKSDLKSKGAHLPN